MSKAYGPTAKHGNADEQKRNGSFERRAWTAKVDPFKGWQPRGLWCRFPARRGGAAASHDVLSIDGGPAQPQVAAQQGTQGVVRGVRRRLARERADRNIEYARTLTASQVGLPAGVFHT